VHKRCSGVKASLCKASNFFVCIEYLCPTDTEVYYRYCQWFYCKTVNEFCYIWDMLTVDGDADAAVTVRICSGCFKFTSLASFIAAKDVSLLL